MPIRIDLLSNAFQSDIQFSRVESRLSFGKQNLFTQILYFPGIKIIWKACIAKKSYRNHPKVNKVLNMRLHRSRISQMRLKMNSEINPAGSLLWHSKFLKIKEEIHSWQFNLDYLFIDFSFHRRYFLIYFHITSTFSFFVRDMAADFYTYRKISLELRLMLFPLWAHCKKLPSGEKRRRIFSRLNENQIFKRNEITSSRIIRHVSKTWEYSKYLSASFKYSYTLQRPL